MAKDDYTPRRAQGPKRRHPLRSLLILLLLLACAAFAALRWGPPLWHQSLREKPPPSAQRAAPTYRPYTSGADRAASTQSAQPDGDSSEPAPQPETTSEEPTSSAPEEPEPQSQPTAFDGEIDLLMLVNSTHALPEGYTVDLTELSNGQSVATLIYPALQQMFDDARSQGIYPVVASGYRTPEKQQSLMDEKIQSLVEQGYSQESAQAEALKWVNQVGYSEHQSGLAVDINADGIHSAGYEVYDWLAQNAWQYGFILRYPEDKTDITGTSYEPWHYRYVGVEAAQAITEQGVCLEEYLGEA